MSFLNTLSTFYYGITITKENQNLNFDEGSGELTAVLQIGDYTHTEILTAIENAFNLAGTQVYTATLNRMTRIITISSVASFDLLCNSGSQVGSSSWDLLGFSTATDKTGAATYLGENPSGYEYRPQLLLNNYIQPEDYEVKESAVVNISVSGIVQTLQFGDGQRMQCNIRGASNLTGIKTDPFYENVTGVQDLRTFMKYLITKAKIEFIPDVDDRNTFHSLLLESTPADKSGTRFVIENMNGSNSFFETGTLAFRKVIS
jgi:hypothetical protein